MTAPLPPTSGAVGDGSEQSKLSYPQGALAGDIQASLPDLDAMADQAQSNAHEWQAQVGPLMDSAAGYGLGGLTIAGGNAAGADGDWPTNVSFPHEGP
jgi:hypothetical protein